MKSKKPTAKERTISIFTGKTISENGEESLDGSQKAQPKKEPRSLRLYWRPFGDSSSWAGFDKPEDPRAKCWCKVTKKAERKYVANWEEKPIGEFTTVMEAANACDQRALSVRVK